MGLQILQNLQDQIQCKKLKLFKDFLSRQTEKSHSTGSLRKQRDLDDNKDCGMSIEEILTLVEAEQFACTLSNIENENGMNGRTLKLIGETTNFQHQC